MASGVPSVDCPERKRRVASEASKGLGRYPNSSAIALTRSAVSRPTNPTPRRASETVATETPALAAISESVG